MKENVTLLQEINTLRSREHGVQLSIESLKKQIQTVTNRGRGLPPDQDVMTEDQQREAEANAYIEQLSQECQDLDQEMEFLAGEQKNRQAQINEIHNQMEAQRQAEAAAHQ